MAGPEDRRPRVSVIIPLYNRAHTIGRCLESVYRQSLDDLEIIVVDDASQDGGLGRLPRIDPRVRVIRHAVNRGAAAARNTAIRAARGDYVALLDSDDEWLPEKLAVQVARLEALGASHEAAVSAFILIDEPGGARRVIDGALRRDPQRSLLLGCTVSPGSTLICRRDCFAHVGAFDERLRRLEDWDWLLSYSRHRTLAMIERPLAVIHGNAASYGPEVLAALAAIETRHAAHVATLGRGATRMFRSTLMLERAAAAYRGGDRRACAALLARSLLLYPWRGRLFGRALARLARRAGRRNGRFSN